MRRIWRYKLFQWIVFILIAASLGLIISKLEALQFVLQNGNLSLENDIIVNFIEDIKAVRIISITLWALALGLYINFIYSMNRQKAQKTCE